VIYDLLFKASAKTMITIAADPKHLGAKVGFTSVLHSWGSAMTHHLLPGSGLHSKPREGAHPYDCSRRRNLLGRIQMGSLPTQLLPAGARPLTSVPRPSLAGAQEGPCRPASPVLQ
jgi:hypothetical protein